MLQSAMFAQSMDAPRHIVAAALLHDIGYFLHPASALSIEEGRNVEHEALGAAWLSRAFGEEVTRPIALHVEAKRYLCATEAGYFDRLSDASRASLVLQGGVMNESEVAEFAREPVLGDVLVLRRCDDLGKDPSMRTPSLEDFRELLKASLRTN